MLVWQNEVIDYVERIMERFALDEETLALDLIDQVGPGGTFVDQLHTVEHFRREVWMPGLLDRAYWAQWEQAGRPDTARRVRERLDELLASYVPEPLATDVERDFQRILADARKHLPGA
jgi:trimethylamine--corrinoid protein Co-methyltransferase